MNVWYALGPQQKIKPVKYVVKWQGGTATLTVTCTGAAVGPKVDRRRTCTVPPVSEQSSDYFNIAFTNDIAASINSSQLVVCHASRQALLDACDIFNPDYVEACGLL